MKVYIFCCLYTLYTPEKAFGSSQKGKNTEKGVHSVLLAGTSVLGTFEKEYKEQIYITHPRDVHLIHLVHLFLESTISV